MRVCAVSASGETSHPQRAKPFCRKPTPFGKNPQLPAKAGLLETFTFAKRTGTIRADRAELKGSHIERAPLLDTLPRTSVSPTRCRERIGVSPAAPRATVPFESKWYLACRADQGFRSDILPRRRMLSGKPGCFPPLRRPFGYVRIAPYALSDSVSSSRRRPCP